MPGAQETIARLILVLGYRGAPRPGCIDHPNDCGLTSQRSHRPPVRRSNESVGLNLKTPQRSDGVFDRDSREPTSGAVHSLTGPPHDERLPDACHRLLPSASGRPSLHSIGSPLPSDPDGVLPVLAAGLVERQYVLQWHGGTDLAARPDEMAASRGGCTQAVLRRFDDVLHSALGQEM